MSDYSEDKHPRDANGRFVSSGDEVSLEHGGKKLTGKIVGHKGQDVLVEHPSTGLAGKTAKTWMPASKVTKHVDGADPSANERARRAGKTKAFVKERASVRMSAMERVRRSKGK